MARRDNYNTKQKEIILETIKNNDKEFTIKEIHEQLKDSTGLTTIYRLVDKLVEEGFLNKRIGDDNTTFYQYLEKCDCSNHFYLKCINCGKLIHVDCDCIKELSDHILNEHCFVTTKEHIIINGTCSACIKN